MLEEFQKAHQVGDTHPNGKLVWTEYKPGKFDWREIKKNKGQSNGDSASDSSKPKTQSTSTQTTSSKNFEDMTPDELADFAESAATSSLEKVVNDKKLDSAVRQIAFNVLKERGDYDKTKVDSSDLQGGYIAKPTAKVTYQNKKPAVEIEVPENWIIRVPGASGALENKKASASGLRKLYAGKSDDDLLKVLNNQKFTWQNRQLAYEEAAARGIDENDIDISGTLEKEWNAKERKHKLKEAMKGSFIADEQPSIDIDFKGLNPEEFMKEFPEGDLGWLNKNDPRVRSKFHDFKTLNDRQQYDAFKTLYEPTTLGYLNPDNKIGLLNEQYENFIKYDTAPLFVSAGGAGAGKTYGWESIAEENNLVKLDDEDNASNNDWGYVMLSDPDDDADFRRMLGKFNGTYIDDNGEEHPRILVFDDSDKILTTRSGPMKALMKKITDNNPKNRIFNNPITGKNEVFKGAILIMTNKDVAAITNASEDAKAIMSRGLVNDMSFTRAESMDLINRRYKTMGLGSYQKAFEKQFPNEKDRIEIREIARDWLEEHIDDADPAKFTPRTFIQLVSLIGPKIAKGASSGARTINGNVQIGTNVPWQVQALNLIKADDYDLEKALNDDFSEEARIKEKKDLLKRKKELKKKDPRKYKILYGEDSVDAYLFGETYKETEKAETLLDFGSLSLEDAEKLLIG